MVLTMDEIIFSKLAFVCLLLGYSYAVPSDHCGFPGSPAHCNVSFSDNNLSTGTVATYQCERGFELLGPSRRVCDENGSWTPDGIPFCVINVAAGKAPMQVSTEDGGVPQKALDGSTSRSFKQETCTLTKKESVPWWYVNLLEPYMVQLVRLDFGASCCGENEPAEIIVRVGNNRPELEKNPICNRFVGFIEEGQPLFLPCNPPMPGAFVSVHLVPKSPQQLSLCEAFVYTDQALPIERCPQFRDQPPGSTATYNGKCYIFYDRQPATFIDALEFCRARGGTLIDESNPALQGFISWELWRRHRSDSSSNYWLGAVRDPQHPAYWKWVNGQELSITFWDAPDALVEACARFDGSKGWLWTDTACKTTLNFICQHQPKECGRPEQPPNSRIHTQTASDSVAVRASIEYACDEGHLLVGPTVRTCLDTGYFNKFAPICKRIECGFPAEILHGNFKLLNGSVSYLAHVEYSCAPGYEMAGRALLVCDIDERWNGPPPRCEVVLCEDLQPIANGQVIVNSSAYGSEAEFVCAKGFKLQGVRSVTCQASGLWDNPPPLCIPEKRRTLPPPSTTTTTTTTSTTSTAPPTTSRPILRRIHPSSPTPFVASSSPTPPPPPPRPLTYVDQIPTATLHSSTIRKYNFKNQKIGGESNNNILTKNNTAEISVEGTGAKINVGAVVALAAFGVLVFVVAVVTTLVILFKSKQQTTNTYQHQLSPMGSLGSSSSSESQGGLNRSYALAWEQLHDETAGAAGPSRRQLRRQDCIELASPATPNNNIQLASPDFVSKKRHHHHHNHLNPRKNIHSHKLRF